MYNICKICKYVIYVKQFNFFEAALLKNKKKMQFYTKLYLKTNKQKKMHTENDRRSTYGAPGVAPQEDERLKHGVFKEAVAC